MQPFGTLNFQDLTICPFPKEWRDFPSEEEGSFYFWWPFPLRGAWLSHENSALAIERADDGNIVYWSLTFPVWFISGQILKKIGRRLFCSTSGVNGNTAKCWLYSYAIKQLLIFICAGQLISHLQWYHLIFIIAP